MNTLRKPRQANCKLHILMLDYLPKRTTRSGVEFGTMHSRNQFSLPMNCNRQWIILAACDELADFVLSDQQLEHPTDAEYT